MRRNTLMKKPRARKSADPPPTAGRILEQDGLIVSHLLVVRDVARSRHFYVDVLGAKLVLEGPPSMLRFHNSWLVLSAEGGPTDDRPGVCALAPRDDKAFVSALGLRVANLQDVYDLWRARGAAFLTPPVEHHDGIRCYLRDPDGHLIELAQATQRATRPDTQRRVEGAR